MGKNRDIFKKIRDTKGKFHAKMGSIKDINGMDLTEEKYIKKRWQEYTKLYKKDLHNPDNHNDVITHLEPDIQECEVKWALGSITTNKASGGDGFLIELFKILKDDAVKVLHSICQQIWKNSSRHRTGNGQFSFQSQGKAMPKNAQATAQLNSSHRLATAAAAKLLQSCPTLCNPIDGSLPGSSVHVIFQARVLEWGAIAFSHRLAK